MCNFFSCCSNGRGKLFYFDAKARAALRENNPKNYEPDSHTSIADYHGYPGKKEDKLNKYEFNPLTRKFIIDQINTKDDSVQVGANLFKLDFKTIVPELIIKPIVNPLRVKRRNKVTKHELALLKAWVFVYDSVYASVRASVCASVCASACAYISSFFELPQWEINKKRYATNPFQCCIDLWEAGLVPSYDGKQWRLHSGPKAKIVWKGTL